MKSPDRIGTYLPSSVVAGENYYSYLPPPLPPEPAIDLNNLYPLIDQANAALGRLDGMSMVLPDSSLFLYMYVRKEAVLSSQIEGTQSSLSDLLLYENINSASTPIDDVSEVSCYVSAMNYGLKRLGELPLCLRLLREMHEKLMSHARGGTKQPGEFRTSQNWIGGTRPGNADFVPPPPERLRECLDAFEKFLHNDAVKLPVLVKVALAHVQFETIHPFLDGNGRLGRLLITLILCQEGILKVPLLYLSLYFKVNRKAYYAHLQSIRESGDWESWLEFFLKGVIETANQATEAAQKIIALFKKDRAYIESTGNATAGILTIHTYLQHHPITNTTAIRQHTGLSQPTVMRSMTTLEKLGIVSEQTGKPRHKIFAYQAYLNILKSGTAPMGY